MRGVRTAATCITAICALFAFAASRALAFENVPHFGKCTAKAGGKYRSESCTKLATLESEQKFEWEPLATAVTFTTTKEKETGKMVIEQANGNEFSCTGQSSKEGEFGPGNLSKNVVLELTGCESLGAGCNSEGKPSGTVFTKKLHGEPGIVTKELKEEKNIDGLDFRGEANEFVAEFSCGPAPFVVKGGVVVKTQQDSSGGTTGEFTNKMESSLEIEFVAEKPGTQIPSKWTPNGEGVSNSKHEEITEHLEANVAGKGYEGMGWSLTTDQKISEKVELRQCEKTISCPN